MKIFDEIKNILDVDGNFDQLTLGRVVDTNDPQQMGRVRVQCPFFGDNDDTIVGKIPWAAPISPLAGTSLTATRGREASQTRGPVAYGMFNVPKVGAHVLVACVEGDPRFRVYLGCINDQFLPHTLPHGRYTYNKTDDLQNEPSGPLSSTGNTIQPLYDHQSQAFTKNGDTIGIGIPEKAPRKNYEYRTRGSDVGVAGIDGGFIGTNDVIFTLDPDDKNTLFTEPDGNTITNTHGYAKTRTEEGLKASSTGDSYDPQVYSWTTPGFHSVSMSDAAKHCRMRFRSTHGHQIIMDDTNERVYISTAGGKTWIELDEKGNIDIYGERNISVHAEKDINFTAGDTFRVKAKNGIHLISENEVRVHAKDGNLHLKSGANTELHAVGDMSMSVKNLFLTATEAVHIKASGGVLNLESSADANILSGGQIIQTGTQIHFNGPPAVAATSSTPSNTFDAFWTSRVPEHEPWARVMTNPLVTDQHAANTHAAAAEYTYDDPLIGRKERDEDLGRNPKWHR